MTGKPSRSSATNECPAPIERATSVARHKIVIVAGVADQTGAGGFAEGDAEAKVRADTYQRRVQVIHGF